MVDESSTSAFPPVPGETLVPAARAAAEEPATTPPVETKATSIPEEPSPEQVAEMKAALRAGMEEPESQATTEEETPPPPEEEPEETPAPESAAENNKKWYVVKVQSGREESIKEAIERRVRIEGLEQYYGQIVIPTEKETVLKNNKRTVREKKLFPGYIMANVEYCDEILYLFRETSGVGDFVGAGVNIKPQPMPNREVEKMLAKIGKPVDETAPVVVQKPKYHPGDQVKIKDGVFAGMEGEVKELVEAKQLVRVQVVVLGRPVSVELEYWQVEEV